VTASKNGYWRWVLSIGALLLSVLLGFQYFNAKMACDKEAANPEVIDFEVELTQAFPKDFVANRSDCGSLVNGWTIERLGSALYLAGERPIWQTEGKKLREGDFTIRVTHLPTFTHPHIVRVEKRGETITLHGTQLSGRGGYDYANVQQTKTLVLTQQQAKVFSNLYGDGLHGRIWTVFDYAVLDGTSIYLESHDSDGYRVLEETEGNYERLDRLAIFLIETLGWDPHPPRS
jgi:hypothetical protein